MEQQTLIVQHQQQLEVIEQLIPMVFRLVFLKNNYNYSYVIIECILLLFKNRLLARVQVKLMMFRLLCALDNILSLKTTQSTLVGPKCR